MAIGSAKCRAVFLTRNGAFLLFGKIDRINPKNFCYLYGQ